MNTTSKPAAANSATANFFERFTRTDGTKRYVLGVNPYAEAVARVAPVDGFIDEYTTLTTWLGKPVLRLNQIDKDSMVVSAVTNSRPKTGVEKLKAAGVKEVMDYFAFADLSNGSVPQLECITDMRKEHASNSAKFEWIRGLLIDDESRQVFDDILRFRLEANLAAIEKYDFCVDRQYFEPFVVFSEGEVFVDGGGFDGFTSLEFAKRCPGYGSIHFFEPGSDTLVLAKENMRNLHNVNYHLLGLFDRNTTLSFSSGDGSASHISEDGDVKIEVATLDSVVNEPVSFIKLDLEGAEIAALTGMKQHILDDHPKLAVAVYHYPSDFWTIPEYILSLRSDYRIYLRHYTEGWAETIMFFIPVAD
ncbi:FkbM family methyltransferase [Dickeya oryzae]|uniref:FkbM family methyltransferase n=1 Tax=Dickeya oryzae TaxID=1240404 RepID=UPI000576D9E0|nr:FkbM family methyltransferase [Dickeya oryzae]